MPVYCYRCHNGHAFERYLPLAQYQEPQTCDCGEPSDKVIKATMVFVRPEIRYTSPIDGRVITSQAQRADDLARSDCVPYDPELKKDHMRKLKEQDDALDKAVDETVDKTIALMPARKKEKLQAELEGGLTTELVRQTVSA